MILLGKNLYVLGKPIAIWEKPMLAVFILGKPMAVLGKTYFGTSRGRSLSCIWHYRGRSLSCIRNYRGRSLSCIWHYRGRSLFILGKIVVGHYFIRKNPWWSREKTFLGKTPGSLGKTYKYSVVIFLELDEI